MSLAFRAPLSGARPSPCAPLIARALRRFDPAYQPRLRALAALHPHVGDLAAAFPALLFALGAPHRGMQRDAVLTRVIAGAPLKTLAEEARIPFWVRALPPEAFVRPLPPLPDGAWFAHRIANHIPGARHADWLALVAVAHEVADERVAVWVAREGLRTPRPRRRFDLRHHAEDTRLLSLWAWHCIHAPAQVHGQRWNEDLHYAAALTMALDWRADVIAKVELGSGPTDTWLLQPGAVGPFQLLPLQHADAILEEARAMNHCVRKYCREVAKDRVRVWGVRLNGERYATLAVRIEGALVEIADLRLKDNVDAPHDLWLRLRAWIDRHPMDARAVKRRRIKLDRGAWREVWRAYWLAKRRIPDWLPLNPDRALYAL